MCSFFFLFKRVVFLISPLWSGVGLFRPAVRLFLWNGGTRRGLGAFLFCSHRFLVSWLRAVVACVVWELSGFLLFATLFCRFGWQRLRDEVSLSFFFFREVLLKVLVLFSFFRC